MARGDGNQNRPLRGSDAVDSRTSLLSLRMSAPRRIHCDVEATAIVARPQATLVRGKSSCTYMDTEGLTDKAVSLSSMKLGG